MIGVREQNSIVGRRPGERLTLLDCQIGGHTGHFRITRVIIDGEPRWGCDEHINQQEKNDGR